MRARRRRQAEGQARAKAEGRYRGRLENTERNAGIAAMLRSGSSWSQVQATTGCSRATIAKIAKRAVESSDEPVKPKVARPVMNKPVPVVEVASGPKITRPRMLRPEDLRAVG